MLNNAQQPTVVCVQHRLLLRSNRNLSCACVSSLPKVLGRSTLFSVCVYVAYIHVLRCGDIALRKYHVFFLLCFVTVSSRERLYE